MGKNIGKPWEHHEKHTGNHWKTIRQPLRNNWKNHLATMEKHKKTIRKPVDKNIGKPFDNYGKNIGQT